jgi:hypothetical protein
MKLGNEPLPPLGLAPRGWVLPGFSHLDRE